MHFGYYTPAVNQIYTYLEHFLYRKIWYARNKTLFLASVQMFVRNTFGDIYPIFNGIQAYGCIIIIIIIHFFNSILYRLCYILTEESNATLIDGY